MQRLFALARGHVHLGGHPDAVDLFELRHLEVLEARALLHPVHAADHDEVVLAHEHDRLRVARLVLLLLRGGHGFDLPYRMAIDLELLHQRIAVVVERALGHVGVAEVRPHEASALVRGRDPLGARERGQVQPLVVVARGIVVVVGEEAGPLDVGRRQEEHDRLLVLAHISAVPAQLAHALAAALVDQGHLDVLDRVVAVVAGVDALHDLARGELAFGKRRCAAREQRSDRRDRSDPE